MEKLTKVKNGFTLLELLAVIVVLAIIMLIGANAVLPMIETSRVGAFKSTATTVLSSAESYHISRGISGQATADFYSIDTLISEDFLENVSLDTYSGCASVNASDKNAFDILLLDKNNGYFIKMTAATADAIDNLEAIETAQTAIPADGLYINADNISIDMTTCTASIK